MASPLEWGTGTALVGLILLVLLGAYAGVIVVLMLAILIASAMVWRVAANAAARGTQARGLRQPAAWALWSVAGLTVAAIVIGTISDPMLGAAMFFSAVAGGVVGFLFRLKGWL